MAESELGSEVDLGHGVVEFGKEEERVVAEATGTARGVENDAFDRAVGCVKGDAIASGDEDAMIAAGSEADRDVGHALQEEHVVPNVGVVVGVRRVDKAGVGSEAGGANAGSAVERVDFETGVIGYD